MIRTLIGAVSVTTGLILGTPAAAASPAFCGAHENGDIYIHACAGSTGGGGFTVAPGCRGTSACVAVNKTWRAAHPGEDLPEDPN